MRAPQKITLSTVDIEVGGQARRVTLRHNPRARRLSLRFDAVEQGFTLTLPPRFPLPRALDFLDAHRGWMQTCLARPAARQAAERVAFVPGAAIPFRGTSCLGTKTARSGSAALSNASRPASRRGYTVKPRNI